MDFIVYVVILVGLGLSKTLLHKSEAVDTLIAKPAEVVEVVSLQVGSNLELYREPDAYTLILEEFGLK